ncbi:two-component regulator propeller domain-containing protein [Aquimarina sp. SS2-1]|uniref:ligand-binding sensor domain-containing protein n=1 Tax=Aquimarina besae TaxID=3342247 RepID=UPI0036711305
MSYSQTHIYTHYGVDEGLPSSEVYDIYQDKEGYIWFATDKGLSRFNGSEFKNFTTKDGLPDNTILDFHPQENGQIWCFGYHSQRLFYFDEVFSGFKDYKYNSLLKNEFDGNTIIKSIVLDEDETLYTGGYGICGLFSVSANGELSKQFNMDSRFNQSIEDVQINFGVLTTKKAFFSICHKYDSEDNVVIVNSENSPASRLDFVFLNKKESVFIDRKLGVLSKKDGLRYYETQHNPIGIKRIDDNTFFVGYYSNGAEIKNTSGEIIETFLPKKSVTSFLRDAEGSYWFSTLDDGVYCIKNPGITVLTKDHISSLVKDNNSTLYAGYGNGDIAKISNKQIDIIYKGLNDHPAYVEFNSRNNNLYGYSDNCLVNYSNKKKPSILPANKLPEYIDDPLLNSGTSYFNVRKNDTVIRYNLDEKVQDVCTYNGDVLIGTSSGLFTLKNEVIKKYQPTDILKSRIDDIDLHKKSNTIYMATQGQGVIVYGDSIYNITQKNGLTNNIVSEVHIENDTVVWACTNSGLNRINFNKNNSYFVTSITKADGLLSNDIDDIEIIGDTIWVATKKGLCYFTKDFFKEKQASKIISLKLKEVSVNNTNIGSLNTYLKHYQNSIDFTLQAVSHRNTDKINYFYRLKEKDTTWTKTDNRKIHFPSLSPGDYTFQAKANVLNNPDNHLVSYTFTILPPFWKSWWFYGICFVSFCCLVYLFFKIRVLTYNQDVFRELIRLAIKRLKRKEQFYNFRANGEDFKIPTHQIQYINSQGNYLDITTNKKTYTIRCKIGDFINTTPDALEYVRIHRSYIIRIDQVTSKGKNWVVINDQRIPVGDTYLNELDKIQF